MSLIACEEMKAYCRRCKALTRFTSAGTRAAQLTEEGQHFKAYAVAKPFCVVAAATADAQQTGGRLLTWFRKGASKAVRRPNSSLLSLSRNRLHV